METLAAFENQLKLLYGHLVAKDIMFSKQRLFEPRDKPGKNFAWLLADVCGKDNNGKMRKLDDTFAIDPMEKLEGFSDFYSVLYVSISLATQEIDVGFCSYTDSTNDTWT